MPLKVIPSWDKLALWSTDAVTVFLNGCYGGLAAGGGVGGGSAALETIQGGGLSHLSDSAAKGLGLAAMALLGNGMKAFVVWQHTNPMPNPFRSDQPPHP